MWQTFFSPSETLFALGLQKNMSDVVDFGCGYGTFTIPSAEIVERGTVHAFDIEPDMLAATRGKAGQRNLSNIRFYQRDFASDGTGLPDASADYVMLFNILHAEERGQLLAESFRILRKGGTLGIMHWNYDHMTPRGPSMDIRLSLFLASRMATSIIGLPRVQTFNTGDCSCGSYNVKCNRSQCPVNRLQAR